MGIQVVRFRTTIVGGSGNTTGIEVPDEIVEELGAGKRPAVHVKVGDFAYRSTIARMGGVYMIPLSAERREAAAVAAGHEVDIELELDTEPREVVVPADFASALDADAEAKRFFDSLSYSNKSRHVLSIDGAKTAETRQRRIDTAIETLRAGKK